MEETQIDENPPTLTEIVRAIKSMKYKKAASVDGAKKKLLKYCMESMPEEIEHFLKRKKKELLPVKWTNNHKKDKMWQLQGNNIVISAGENIHKKW